MNILPPDIEDLVRAIEDFTPSKSSSWTAITRTRAHGALTELVYGHPDKAFIVKSEGAYFAFEFVPPYASPAELRQGRPPGQLFITELSPEDLLDRIVDSREDEFDACTWATGQGFL